jgi:hypothetical protein
MAPGLQDFLVDVALGVPALEGGLASDELVAEHSHAPDVDLLVVVLAENDIRGDVVQGAAESLAVLFGGVDGPPEVGELESAVAAQDVLGLYVSVQHALAVQVEQGLDHLPQVEGRLGLGEALLGPQLPEDVAPVRQLQHHVDAVLVRKKAIELQDVRVSRVALDLYFLLQLEHHLAFQHCLLTDLLESQAVPREPVLGHEDLSESTFTQLFAYFESLDIERSGRMWLRQG